MMRLGAVADDVTGACDLAGRVVEAGLPASVLFGTAGDERLFPSDGDGCAVVALKIRTVPAAEAATQAATAARRLLAADASLLYQKYCSTFDSTPRGNIGPIADAMAEVAGGASMARGMTSRAVTVGTPATPASARTQYAGTLFADGVPLAESPLREHPLTPMRDSNVMRLLSPQTRADVSLVRWEDVQRGPEHVAGLVGEGHVLTDALTERDLDTIAASVLRLAGERPVVAAGAAGVGTALARVAVRGAGTLRPVRMPVVPVTGRLILAGSASAATRAQLDTFRGEKHLLDPFALAEGEAELDRLRVILSARRHDMLPALVAVRGDVAGVQAELGLERAAQVIEGAFSELANFAVHELGVSHLIVAGGETSGAIVTGLGIQRLLVGAQAAPGVPWTVGDSHGRSVALLLKSGNFGGTSLFNDAWETAP